MGSYGKGTELVNTYRVSDCEKCEREVLNALITDPRIVRRMDLGNEYFEGKLRHIESIIAPIVIKYNTNTDDEMFVEKYKQPIPASDANNIENDSPETDKCANVQNDMYKRKRFTFPPYQCPRCLYTCTQKQHMIQHFSKTKPCPGPHADKQLSLDDDIKAYVLANRQYNKND
jgi:hypothetical protein